MTLPKVYEQHEKSFPQVAAYVVLKDGERVATIAFKFPKDGAGRLYAYVHWIGVEMVRGQADGYGYDKKSAAVESAMSQMFAKNKECPILPNTDHEAFFNALDIIGGSNWNTALEKDGFTVLQAV